MNTAKHLGLSIIVAFIALFGLDVVSNLPIPGADRMASTAQAVVGRPLTPVSVAGAARRTTRRCAAGVYNC